MNRDPKPEEIVQTAFSAENESMSESRLVTSSAQIARPQGDFAVADRTSGQCQLPGARFRTAGNLPVSDLPVN